MRKTTRGLASLALLLGVAPAIALAADPSTATPDESYRVEPEGVDLKAKGQ